MRHTQLSRWRGDRHGFWLFGVTWMELLLFTDSVWNMNRSLEAFRGRDHGERFRFPVNDPRAGGNERRNDTYSGAARQGPANSEGDPVCVHTSAIFLKSAWAR
jgi:hypothetical protein